MLIAGLNKICPRHLTMTQKFAARADSRIKARGISRNFCFSTATSTTQRKKLSPNGLAPVGLRKKYRAATIKFCDYLGRTPGLPTSEKISSTPPDESVSQSVFNVSSGSRKRPFRSSSRRITAAEILVRAANCFTDQFSMPRAARNCAPVSLDVAAC